MVKKDFVARGSGWIQRAPEDGKDGESVKVIETSVTYAISASAMTPPSEPSDWKAEVQKTTDSKPYLWSRTIVKYSGGASTTTFSVSYNGKDGEDGKDAIDIVLSPAKLTFTADANGNPLITSDNNKSMLTVMRGKKDVSRGITDVAVTGMLCNAITSTVNDNRMIFIESISKQEVSVTTSEGIVKKYVPATSGSINISFLLDGVRYTASLPFTVDVKTVLGGVYSDNEKFYTHYEEITNELEDKINQVQDDTNDNLTQLSSRIEETASQIKLEVSQQPYAVRNLLPGSSFRRQGECPYIDPLIRIERNTGKGGVSCLHIATQYGGSGEGGYLGAFWDSTYTPFAASGIPVPSDSVADQNIPIQNDTDYTLSCWVKADNTDLTFCIEVFEMAVYNSANRGIAHRQTFTVSQIDTWQLVEFTIHGKEITSPYLAVNFWCNAKTTKPLTDGTYPAVNAYICQPMLDAASQYSGWSLSPSDGDYQGGNLLDSTATLIPSDSATSTAGQSTPLLQVADSAITLRAYEGVYSVAHVNNTTSSSIELLRWNVENVIQDNHDYILSFLAKGTGSITTYLYRDGTPRLYVESINGEQPQLSADGAVSIPVTSEWKRYWVHYRLRATAQYPNLPDKLLFRVMSGNDISICQPKLEDGARPTSYTERKTDLVDKASLKKAGIEITTNQVKLYGDKVQVLTRKDGTTKYEEAGMFSNGKLNANLIDAINIVTQALQTGKINADKATIRNLSIIGSLRNPFTRVSESTDVDFNDNIAVITKNYLWEKNEYSLPWDNTQNGRRVTIMNLKWNTEIATTGADIKAPEGMYFFEDGLMKSKLHFSRECVELLGIGDDTKFFGWVVTNRTELSSLWCSGSTAKVLAYGSIKAKVVDNKLQLDVTQISFDGKKIEVTQENGGYKMKFPTSWGSAVNFVPVITPYKFIGHIYIYDIGEDYMIIKYSGKSSENKDWDDASFRFTIQSTKTFPNYNA